MINAPQLSRSRQTGLYLIGNEQGAIFLRSSPYTRPEIIWRDDPARFALDRLEDHTSHTNTHLIANFQLLFNSARIPLGNVIDLPSIHHTHRLAKIRLAHH